MPDVIANKLDHLLILTSGTEQYLITCTNKKYKFLLTTTLTISDMEIGKKLKNARVQSGMTQENVAEKINVSRQTISNWENEKSYPDIISVIELSNLYSISLDVLLKGDEKMIEHLEESTNVVKSNQKMIWAIIVNIIVVALLITLNMFIPDNRYFLVGIFCLMVITSSALLYQIIKKF